MLLCVCYTYIVFRYGCPGSEEKQYREFADFYDKHYSGMLKSVLNGFPYQLVVSSWSVRS